MLTEQENYLQRIENLRQQVIDLITGLPPEALNWRPIEGDAAHAANSLAVLAAHIAGAEHFWIAEVVGRRPPSRDRAAEFSTQATSADGLRQRLEQVGQETRAILSSLPPHELKKTRNVEGQTVPVRWAILHVIDHTALHLGHMQLTYQLWAKGESKPSPFWHQRLPRETAED